MRRFLASVVMVLIAGAVSGQQAVTNFNQFYRYPLSVGLFYQGLTPFSAYNTPYTIYDIGADVRMPIPTVPVLQPFARLGIMRFDSIDAAFPEKWDHFHLYCMAGAAYANRFARNFEFGADLGVGISEAIFPHVVDTGTVGSPFLLLGAGGRVGLDPSYNFNIEFQPSLRYLLSLSPLKTFDGFVFSIGITASYRFGEDPDSARAIIRALRLDSLSFGPAFGAMQSYYADNPLGTVTVTNTERQPVTNLEISFLQPGYMDVETLSFTQAVVKPGDSVAVPLKAVFNKQVFTTEGKTPLSGQIIAKYKLGGRDVEQREPVSYVLYDKTAITWSDNAKVGAFITPQDGSLKTWTAAVSEETREATLPALNQSLQIALQIYQALSATGIQYQEDPSSPFTRVQGRLEAVDSINLARTTLRQRYGDCDDLTVLFASLLETRSVPTAFITVPGHIYAAFDTGVAAESYAEINPDRSMTLAIGGTLWIPVEVTLLDGKSDFLAAWQAGIALWNASAADRQLTKTAEAQEVYAPVGLQEALLQPIPPAKDVVVRSVTAARDRLADVFVKPILAEVTKTKGKREYNRLGIAYARFGRYADAIGAFTQSTKADPSYASAQVNLANVYYLQKDYKKSITGYTAVLKQLDTKGASASVSLRATVLLNLSQVSSASGDTKASQEYLAQAQQADPATAQEFLAVASGEGGGGRAASAAGRVILVDEDQ
ncbi:MAG: tetratricopeptide repeat protein [Spirochaetes bacterium]|nr:tetratricopeptide repeat protein [Spirochaetota bacterium]